MVKGCVQLIMQGIGTVMPLRAAEHHLPYSITQLAISYTNLSNYDFY